MSLSPKLLACARDAAARLVTPEYVALLSRMPHELIIDMDDTLNVNSALFETARDALLDIYQDLAQGLHSREQMREEHLVIDRSNVAAMGFGPVRWFHSAEQAGIQFSVRELTPLDRERIREAAALGLGPGELYPGVLEALRALNQAGTRTVLKTKGERSKQQEKIDHHGLADFFPHIEIVPLKNAESFAEIAARYDMRSPISIGDRYGADIEPALACGFRGILVGETVDWEHAEQLDAGHVPQVSSLAEALILLADEQRDAPDR